MTGWLARPGVAGALEPWRQRFLAPSVTLPSWAKDAPHRLIYSSDAGGSWEIYCWDREQGSHRRITERPEGTALGAIDPSGRFIWWLEDECGNEWGVWVAVPFGEPDRQINRWSPKLAAAYAAGLALAREYAVIGTSNAERGYRVHLVANDGRTRLLYSHERPASVRFVSADDSLVCLSQSENGESLHPGLLIVDTDGHRIRTLWDGPGRGLVALGFSPVEGDQRLLVRHERDDQPRPMIYDVANDAVLDVKTDLMGSVDARWWPSGRELLLMHHERGRTGLYRYEIESGRLAKQPMDRGTVTDARVRPDGEIWYTWTRANRASRICAGGRILLQAAGEPALGGVAYEHHDVEGIHVLTATPERPGPHPTVFRLHGGPAWQDREEFDPDVQAWVDHGFAVALINYRGSAGYGRQWRTALIGNPGFTELEDLARVRQWAVDRSIADPQRLVVAGESWGGFLTLLSLGVQPGSFALGIAIVPMADPVLTYEQGMEPVRRMDRALFGGAPHEIPEVYQERSPMSYVDRVRAPVLMLIGRNDPRCPMAQAQAYVERLQALGLPHRVYYYDSGHRPLVKRERVRQMRIKLAFTAQYLGTAGPGGREAGDG